MDNSTILTDKMYIKLKYILLAIFVMVFLGISLSGWLYMKKQQEDETRRINQNLSAIADLKVQQIVNWRNERLGDANLVYKSNLIAETVESYLSNPYSPRERKHILDWMTVIQKSFSYKKITLYDNKLKPLISVPSIRASEDESLTSVKSEVLSSDKILMFDLYREKSGGIAIDLTVPVYPPDIKSSAGNTSPIAFIIFEIDPYLFLYPLIQKWPTPSKTAETLLVERKGDKVLYLNELRHVKGTALKLEKPVNDPNLPAAIALSGRKGAFEGIDYRGVPVIAASEAIPGTAWTMIAKMDKTEIYKPMYDRLFATGLAIAVILIASILGISGIWWRYNSKVLERDIETRRRSEAVIRESEEKFHLLADFTHDWDYWIDNDRHFVYSSPSCEQITGYKPEEFIINPELVIDIVHKDDRERIASHINEFHASDKLSHAEFRIIHKDGSVRWIDHVCKPILNSASINIGRRASNRDITERKKSEALLQRERELYIDLVNTQPAGIYRLRVFPKEASSGSDNPHYVIEMVNDRFYEILGIEKEIIKINPGFINEMIYSEDKDGFTAKRIEANTNSTPFSWEGRINTNTGIKWVHYESIPRPAENGDMLWTGIIYDITESRRREEERRKIEEGLQQTQRLESLGVLAGGIAHDFNNILTAILGNAELALMDLSELSPARPRIESINKASLRAADLCRQMLAYSGKGRFVIMPVDLSEIVEEMSRMLEVSVSKKAILNFKLAKELPSIHADVFQIQQIIMNLIINASEAIGENSGAIYIETGLIECNRDYLQKLQLQSDLKEGYYVYLEVADTGCGMDKTTMSKIFDPFFSTKFTGRGLGLSAVQGIVKGHKGAMKIYSEPGKGSTFKVLFPVVDALPNSVSPEQKEDDKPWKISGTVLLVDDEESIRALGRLLLERLGFDVMLASDGREALNIFNMHKEKIRCIILDLTMPHMDGEQTFRELRSIDPEIPVIMSSGYNEQDVVHRFLGKSLSGFIQKPYRISSLVEALRKVLQ
jgi:PAS domain S-box-containing protein